jgi:hypothetical protein
VSPQSTQFCVSDLFAKKLSLKIWQKSELRHL